MGSGHSYLQNQYGFYGLQAPVMGVEGVPGVPGVPAVEPVSYMQDLGLFHKLERFDKLKNLHGSISGNK